MFCAFFFTQRTPSAATAPTKTTNAATGTNREYASGAPDSAGVAACVRGRHGIARLSAERIRAELIKLLVAPGAERAIRAMYESGLLVGIVGAAPRLSALDRMIAIEAAAMEPPSAVRRLGALSLHAEGDARRNPDRTRPRRVWRPPRASP